MASLARARDHHHAGRYDDAIHELRAVLKKDPESSETRLQLAASQLAKVSSQRESLAPHLMA